MLAIVLSIYVFEEMKKEYVYGKNCSHDYVLQMQLINCMVNVFLNRYHSFCRRKAYFEQTFIHEFVPLQEKLIYWTLIVPYQFNRPFSIAYLVGTTLTAMILYLE